MNKITRRSFVIAGSAVMLGALTGCGGGSSAGNATNGGAATGGSKVLTFGCQSYSAGAVSTVSETNCAWNAMRYGITESLFKFTDTMDITGWLAEDKYDVNDAHTEWTFYIKKGNKFSNGADVTATKVKECYEWLKAEGPNGSSNPQNFLEFDATITADDDKGTVTIKTVTPYPNLAKNLAHPIMAIVNVADTTDFDRGIIGSGPYAIAKYTTDLGYDMVANQYYATEVPYDEVSIMFLGDATAKANALKGKQIDVAENIANASDLKELKEDSAYTVNITNGVRTGLSFINFKGILANDDLRHALLTAIDGETIASVTVGGLYNYGYSCLPSNLDYNYSKLKNPDAYSKEKAIEILDKAGIVDSDGDGIRELDGKKISLNWDTYTNRGLADMAQACQQLLKEVGIEVNVNVTDSDSLWNKMVNGDFDLSSSNWITVATGDPTDYLANWASTNKADYCGYKNDTYDAAYAALKTEFDADKRKELITTMQQCLLDDAGVVIHGYYNSSMISRKETVSAAPIHTADYYWLSTEIKPA